MNYLLYSIIISLVILFFLSVKKLLKIENESINISDSNIKYNKPKIHLIGDSITEYSFKYDLCGFGVLLTNYYNRYADVINRGFSGYNTEYVLKLFNYLYPNDMNKNEIPILATIMLGSNDATGDCDPRFHIPLDKYKNNLIKVFYINY